MKLSHRIKSCNRRSLLGMLLTHCLQGACVLYSKLNVWKYTCIIINDGYSMTKMIFKYSNNIIYIHMVILLSIPIGARLTVT